MVFILADDCSAWDLGVYGNKDSKTPAIDQLAKEGMMFTKCYQSSPMCSPTRQNILTGLSPFRSGAYPNHTNVNSDVKSIAHYLQPLGYRVALGGKQHYGPDKNFPIEYLGKEKGNDLDPDFDRVETFLQETSGKQQPFCLFVCSNQPHSPWNKGDTSLFDRDKIKLPPFYADLPATRTGFRNYLAEINYLDRQVKHTLDLLEKYKLAENTIVVFASEQGNSFPFAKWTCYNIGLRSALIVRWPGKIKPNSVSHTLVEYSDITPTFVDLAGGNATKNFDGKSLVPVLINNATSHKPYSFGQMTTRGIINGAEYYPIRSVTNGRYRYIINLTPEMEFKNAVNNNRMFREWEDDAKTNAFTRLLVNHHLRRPAEELFDDELDPYNMNNRIGDPFLADIKNELKTALANWMKHTGDNGILTELNALEHMPGKASRYAVIIDTIKHKPATRQGSIMIQIPAEGYYSFYIKGGGSLLVNDHLVVAANATAPANALRYGIIGLLPGRHSIILKNNSKDDVRVSGPQMPIQALDGKRDNQKGGNDE